MGQTDLFRIINPLQNRKIMYIPVNPNFIIKSGVRGSINYMGVPNCELPAAVKGFCCARAIIAVRGQKAGAIPVLVAAIFTEYFVNCKERRLTHL